MKRPDLTHGIETYLPLPLGSGQTPIGAWQAYLDLLRTTVRPLVLGLLAEGYIDWYGFLVHNRQSGVPAPEGDDRLYLHLRLALTRASLYQAVEGRLPSEVAFTRPIATPIPANMDTIRVGSLLQGDVAEAWRVLGLSSEWALAMLAAHDPVQPVPPENVGQFLHYLGNQLFVRAVQIPMP